MIRFVPGMYGAKEMVDDDRRPVDIFLPIKRLNIVLALRGNG